MFCSVFLARLQLRTGILEYANAGHLPPYVLRANGVVEAIVQRPALPVGGMQDTAYTAGSLTLAPGDGLFVYSDGVTEAENGSGAQYGEAQLVADLKELVRTRGRELLDTVHGRVRKHCEGVPQTDDLTALMMRWQPT